MDKGKGGCIVLVGRPKHFLSMENEFMKRGYLLPEGCKDLMDVLKLKQQKYSLSGLPFIWGEAQGTPVHLSPEKIKQWTKASVLKAFDKALKSLTPKLPIKGELTISKPTSISQLAAMIGQKPFQIVADLLKLGIFLRPNEELDFEMISKIAGMYGFLAKAADE